MLITFRSKSTAEVLMLSEHAKPLLLAAGKVFEGEVPDRGVFTPEQLGAAIAGLNHAISGDFPADDNDDDDHLPRHAMAQTVTLKQRAYPLLEMFKKAQEEGTGVTWAGAGAW
jgi:hypothetical protein